MAAGLVIDLVTMTPERPNGLGPRRRWAASPWTYLAEEPASMRCVSWFPASVTL